MTTRLTLAESRAALAELLQLLDVDGSPELVATINRAVSSSQRMLAMTERWLLPVRRATITTVPGRSVYPSPCQREGLVSVGLQIDMSMPPRPLAGGIALDDLPVSQSMTPQRYDMRFVQSVGGVTVSNGGSGYTNGAVATFSDPSDGWAATGVVVATGGVITGITITDPGAGYTTAPTVSVAGGSSAVLTASLTDSSALILTPPPAGAWGLVIDYRDVPPMTLADTDRLVMDELAVIYNAAVMVAPSSGSPRASTIEAEAKVYMGGLRGAGRSGASFQPGGSSRRAPGMVMRNGRWYVR